MFKSRLSKTDVVIGAFAGIGAGFVALFAGCALCDLRDWWKGTLEVDTKC